VLAKVHLDRKNLHEGFIQNKTSVLATFYPRQTREPLDVGKMIQENGSKDAIVKGLSGALAKTIRGFQGHSRATFGRQRLLIAQKLEAFHSAKNVLWPTRQKSELG
jgi:hypothetical protein